MRNLLLSPGKSLTGKLVIAITLMVITGSLLSWYISQRSEHKDLLNNALSYTSSLSDIVKKSLRYDMLTFQRDDVQKTLELLDDSDPIIKVQIFNSRDIISFSSDPKDIGRKAGERLNLPVGRDKREIKNRNQPDDNQWTIISNNGKERVLAYVEPIYNSPDCYLSECHAHTESQKTLGHIRTDFSMESIDLGMKDHILHNLIYMGVFVLVIALSLSFILWQLVLKPLGILGKGLKTVSSGEFPQDIEVHSEDEIGGLTRIFNEMIGELRTTREKMTEWNQSLAEEVRKKTAEIELTRDKLIQADKMAALGRLTADIAHGIRNPLTALGGFGRRLQKTATNPTQAEYAQIVVSEVERLECLLTDILEFSRDVKIDLEATTLTNVINDSIQLFIDICGDSDINVEMDYRADLPVLIDRKQIRQAVDNLLSNSIDVMPEGGTLTICTLTERIHEVPYVAVSVSDTGPGIPEDKLPSIFEPFFTTKKTGEGTGLGLPITKKIVEEHGGFIRVENTPDRGFTVSLYFPAHIQANASQVPCWVYMKCGRDSNNEIKCPAFPHFGRICWAIAGTLCSGKVQGTFAQKCNNCRECEFFKHVNQKQNNQ